MINITTKYINIYNLCTPHQAHLLVMLQCYCLHQQQGKNCSDLH